MQSCLDKIKTLPFVEHFTHFDSLDSTNTFAKRMGEPPRSGIAVVCAHAQSAGRGRGDNPFFSAAGGLFASIVCFIPDIAGHFSLNRALSLAICDSVRRRFETAPLSIKWPNDIYWLDKKLCGILLESLPESTHHLVIGFGINVNLTAEDFPRDLQDIATSVLVETGATVDIHGLLHDILTLFWSYRSLPAADAHSRYCRRLYRPGAEVEINGTRGRLGGVLEDGRLCLKTAEGTTAVTSGSLHYVQADA